MEDVLATVFLVEGFSRFHDFGVVVVRGVAVVRRGGTDELGKFEGNRGIKDSNDAFLEFRVLSTFFYQH